MIKLDSPGMKELAAEFGQHNVEDALLFIKRARDPIGLSVLVEPTEAMIRDILEAIHRRMASGEIRLPAKTFLVSPLSGDVA